jgi:hypothetical protein
VDDQLVTASDVVRKVASESEQLVFLDMVGLDAAAVAHARGAQDQSTRLTHTRGRRG